MNLEETRLRDRVRVLEGALLKIIEATQDTKAGPPTMRWLRETARTALTPAPPAETPATPFEVCKRCGQHHPPGMSTHRDPNGDWCKPAETPAPTVRRDRFEEYEDPVTGETLYRAKAETPAPTPCVCWHCKKPATSEWSYGKGDEWMMWCGSRDCGPVGNSFYGVVVRPIHEPVARDASANVPAVSCPLCDDPAPHQHGYDASDRAEIDRLRAELRERDERIEYLTQFEAAIAGGVATIDRLKAELAQMTDTAITVNKDRERLQAELAAEKKRREDAESDACSARQQLRDERAEMDATTAKLGRAHELLREAASKLRGVLTGSDFEVECWELAEKIEASIADSAQAGEAWAEMVAFVRDIAKGDGQAMGSIAESVLLRNRIKAKALLAKVDARRGQGGGR